MVSYKSLGIITVALFAASMSGYYGGGTRTPKESRAVEAQAPAPERKEPAYFASIPTYSRGSLFMVPGDFNNDGNPDVIVAATDPAYYAEATARLYYFKGDGKGNFSQ